MSNKTYSFQEVWTEAFSQYRLLGPLMKNILRNAATNRLVERGFEEVGTSDVNHELFHMWEIANYDWQKAALIEVDNFAASIRR